MNRLIPIMASVLLAFMLTGCDGVIGVMQTNADANRLTAQASQTEAEAQRLQAETTRAQAATQLEAQRALIDAQAAHTNDLRLIVTLAFVIAALSMGLSAAVFMWARSLARQSTAPPVVYQIGPQPQPAQIGAAEDWPEIRARRRALVAANERRIL